MVRHLGAPRPKILAVLLAAGMMFSTGSVQAQASGGYSVTDPATGDVTYYDGSGNIQYTAEIDPATGGTVYYDANGNPMDPLHAFCWGTSTCSDNGSNTPVSQKEPDFGFAVSPGPQIGDLILEILVPNNDFANALAAQAATYTITGTQGGSSNNKTIDKTATLFSTTAWTSGKLAAYLGIGASPANPIGAYTPDSKDAGATGFYVFQADLGTNHICAQASASNINCTSGDKSPLLTVSSPGLQIGSYIVGFLKTTSSSPNWIATANSGALFDTPEPGTLLLVFGGLLGLGMLRRRVSAQTI